MDKIAPKTLHRILITVVVALTILLVVAAGVYAVAFIILAPMMV